MLWFDVEDLRRWIDVTWERINSLRPPPSVDFSVSPLNFRDT